VKIRWPWTGRKLNQLRAMKVEAVNLRNTVLMVASRLEHGIITQPQAISMLRESIGPLMERVGHAQAFLVEQDALRRN
jgi:hypothetical protein